MGSYNGHDIQISGIKEYDLHVSVTPSLFINISLDSWIGGNGLVVYERMIWVYTI